MSATLIRAAASSRSCRLRRCCKSEFCLRPNAAESAPLSAALPSTSASAAAMADRSTAASARRRDPLVPLRRARAVEGLDAREGHPRQYAVRRRPKVALATPEPRQLGQDAPVVDAVRLSLDPAAHGFAILARGRLHGHQDVGLAQHVLVQHGRALGDQPRHEAPHAPAAHDSIQPSSACLPGCARCGAHRSASSSTRCGGSAFASYKASANAVMNDRRAALLPRSD